MEDAFTTHVTSSKKGRARIHIIATTGEQPALYVVERPGNNGRVIWFGPKGSAFALNQEHLFEALPFLLSFLESGRLVKR